MGKKQQLGTKKIRRCASIIGKPVISACINGGELPHYTAIAWTGANSAYLVNMKKGTALEYVRGGKFIIKRIRLPFKVLLTTKKPKQAFVAIGQPENFRTEETEGNEYYVKLMSDTNAAIDRMRKRYAPKIENHIGDNRETLYQAYLRAGEQLRDEVNESTRRRQASAYGDMT